MAVEVRSVGVSPGASGSTTCVIVKPVGLAVGDLMTAQIQSLVVSVETTTPPEGWDLIERTYAGIALESELFYKIADSDDAAATDFTFTLSKAASQRGAIVAWTGHDSDSPINASNGLGTDALSTTVTSSSITPTVADCMILMHCGIYDNNTQSNYAIADDDPGGWVEAYDLPSNLTNDLSLSMAYALRSETTNTGLGTATTSAADRNIGQLVAIAPAGEPPPGPTFKHIPHCGPRKKRAEFFPTLSMGG